MRVLRVALGSIVGLVAIWVTSPLWKLLVSWELGHGIRLSHGLNELISFLPLGIANGYVLWRIHRRSFTLDVVGSVVAVAVVYCARALLSDPSGGLLLQIWAVPVAFTVGPLAVAAFLSRQQLRRAGVRAR